MQVVLHAGRGHHEGRDLSAVHVSLQQGHGHGAESLPALRTEVQVHAVDAGCVRHRRRDGHRLPGGRAVGHRVVGDGRGIGVAGHQEVEDASLGRSGGGRGRVASVLYPVHRLEPVVDAWLLHGLGGDHALPPPPAHAVHEREGSTRVVLGAVPQHGALHARGVLDLRRHGDRKADGGAVGQLCVLDEGPGGVEVTEDGGDGGVVVAEAFVVADREVHLEDPRAEVAVPGARLVRGRGAVAEVPLPGDDLSVGVVAEGAVEKDRLVWPLVLEDLGPGVRLGPDVDVDAHERVVLGALVVDDGEVGPAVVPFHGEGVLHDAAGRHRAVAQGPVGRGDEALGLVGVEGLGAVEGEGFATGHHDRGRHGVGPGLLVGRDVELERAHVDPSAELAWVAEQIPFGEPRYLRAAPVDDEGLGPGLAVPPAGEGVPVVILDHGIICDVVAPAVGLDPGVAVQGEEVVELYDVVDRVRVRAGVVHRVRGVVGHDAVEQVHVEPVVGRGAPSVAHTDIVMDHRVVDQVHRGGHGAAHLDVDAPFVVGHVRGADHPLAVAHADARAGASADHGRRQHVHLLLAGHAVGGDAVGVVDQADVFDPRRVGAVNIERRRGVADHSVVDDGVPRVGQPHATPHVRKRGVAVRRQDDGLARAVEDHPPARPHLQLREVCRQAAAHAVGVGHETQHGPGPEGSRAAGRHDEIAEDRVGRGLSGELRVFPEEAHELGAEQPVVLHGADGAAVDTHASVRGVLRGAVVPLLGVPVQGVVRRAGVVDVVADAHAGVAAGRVAPHVGRDAVEGRAVVDRARVAHAAAAVVGDRGVAQRRGEARVGAGVAAQLDSIGAVVGHRDPLQQRGVSRRARDPDLHPLVPVVMDAPPAGRRLVGPLGHPAAAGVGEAGVEGGEPVAAAVADVDASHRDRGLARELRPDLVVVQQQLLELRGASRDPHACGGAVVDRGARHDVVVVVQRHAAERVAQVDLAHVEGLGLGQDDDAVPVSRSGLGRGRGEDHRARQRAVGLEGALDPQLHALGVHAPGHHVVGGHQETSAGLEAQGRAASDHDVPGDGRLRERREGVDGAGLVGIGQVVPEAVHARARLSAGVGHSAQGRCRVTRVEPAGRGALRGLEVAGGGISEQPVVAQVHRLLRVVWGAGVDEQGGTPPQVAVELHELRAVVDRAAVRHHGLVVAEEGVGDVQACPGARAAVASDLDGVGVAVQSAVTDLEIEGASRRGAEVDTVGAVPEGDVVERDGGIGPVDAVLQAAQPRTAHGDGRVGDVHAGPASLLGVGAAHVEPVDNEPTVGAGHAHAAAGGRADHHAAHRVLLGDGSVEAQRPIRVVDL